MHHLDAAPKYEADLDFVLKAVKQKGYVLNYAAPEHKQEANSEFTLEAEKQNDNLWRLVENIHIAEGLATPWTAP